MSDEEIFKRLSKLIGAIGPEEVQVALIQKKVCTSLAERLSKKQFGKYANKPSKRTRQRILEVLNEKAS